jgi:hypothetical protein
MDFGLEEFGLTKVEQILIETDIIKDQLEDIENAKIIIGHLISLMREQEKLITSAEQIKELHEKLIEVLKGQIKVLKKMSNIEE